MRMRVMKLLAVPFIAAAAVLISLPAPGSAVKWIFIIDSAGSHCDPICCAPPRLCCDVPADCDPEPDG